MGRRVTRKGSVARRAWTSCLLGSALFAVFGCGSSTPLVPTGPHPPEATVISQRVEFPPPPAQAEVLPLRRRNDCLWRDGHWEWDGRGWRWVRGAWVLPPPGCYYARPETEWVRSGGGSVLIYRRPRWYPDPEENTLGRCEEARSCTSLLPETDPAESDPSLVNRPQRVPTAR